MSGTKTIHWLGAGLSSGPGICKIAESGRSLVLWNRTVEKAKEVLTHCKPTGQVQYRKLDLADLQNSMQAGDVVVSMLPAPMHPEIAELCLAKKAHLVTTSYVSEAMKKYNESATAAGLSFINECGLDPGIDHVFAHRLVNEFSTLKLDSSNHSLEFLSYCGGIPKTPNDFKYKFSWSPAGVVRALTNKARYVTDAAPKDVSKAWESVTNLNIHGETFEVYPNRDSVPYIGEYGFDSSFRLKEFVRGTIRLGGWKQAWGSIFDRIPSMTNDEIEALGKELWEKHAYHDDDQDRVVLYVALSARNNVTGKITWGKSYTIDECGSGINTAMGRLVSLPATFAIEAIENGASPLGVSGAPHESSQVQKWFSELKKMGIRVTSQLTQTEL